MQSRYPSYSFHTHFKLFLEKKSTREPLSEQLDQPSVAYTRGILQLLLLIKHFLNLNRKLNCVNNVVGGWLVITASGEELLDSGWGRGRGGGGGGGNRGA